MGILENVIIHGKNYKFKNGGNIMKMSNYNFFVQKENNSYLAYNSRSNSLAVIKSEDYKKYSDFVMLGKEIKDTKLIDDLKKGLFLIDENVDELKIIRYKMYRDRFNNHSLGLTIAPTSDCNFRCIYCYEKNSIRKKEMTKEVEESIIKFIESQIEDLSSISIAWYGGEPLMRFDIIERLAKKIISLCDKNDVQYFSSIVTNGYLLTPEIATKMVELKIQNVQITLDGRKEIHDKRRIMSDGKGTFDKIFENLKICKDILPEVNLRINVDQTNKEDVNYIYDLLKNENMQDKIIPYLGHVKDSNGCYKDEKCVTTKEFSDLTYKFQSYTNRGLRTFYPILRTNSCGADSLFSFVIDADGGLYKCWDDIGITEKSVGNIIDGITINMKNIDYMTLDPTLHPRCRDCKCLPICMGGCPVNFAAEENCTYFKYGLDKYLVKVANELLLQKNSMPDNND